MNSPQMEQSGKPRTRRVVIARKVSPTEFEEHKTKMESLGLDPSKDPAPPSLTVGDSWSSAFPAAGSSEREPQVAFGGEQYGKVSKPMSASLSNTNAMTEKEAQSRILKGQKMVSLQKRTIEEQIQHGRHDRALEKFTKQQETWEAFRDHASVRTGRHRTDLVVTRTEEHRERKEVMELLDRATPEEEKSGGHSWYHSLRGEGSRFITVGNMFSGLHLPIRMHKENYVHEIVRKPHLAEIANHHDELRKKGKHVRTWRDEEYLMARMRKYNTKMQEHAPGQLAMHELLEPTCIGLRPPENYEFGEFGEGLGDECQAEEFFAQDGDISVVEQTSRDFPEDLDITVPVDALRAGPNVQVLPEKLQFHSSVNKLNTQSITVKNGGTAVIQYEWILNEPQRGFQESILPDNPTDRFTCSVTKGLVLPGCETVTTFTFVSSVPGTFISTWRLSTYPDLLEPIEEVTMHGMCVESDLLLEQRRELQQGLFKQQVLHQVQELIDDVFDNVKLQRVPPPDLTAPLIQERLFEESNSSLNLYWSPHCWQHLTDIGGSIGRLKRSTQTGGGAAEAEASALLSAGVSQELGSAVRGRRPIRKKRGKDGVDHNELHALEGVPSIRRLENELRTVVAPKDTEAALEKRELTVELSRAVRAAQERPLERSPIWWLAYETVMEVAKAVPASYNAARTSCELAAVPFILPPAEDAAPEVIEEYDKQIQERDAKRGEEEKEAEAKTTFVEAFTQEHFGPRVADFEAVAHDTSALTTITQVSPKSLFQRFSPYIGRNNSDSVEINANVLLCEVDLEFLSAFVHTPPAEEGQPPPRPELNLTAEAEELVKQRMLGMPSLLENSPLAVIVVAQVGRPAPDVPLQPRESAVTVEGEGAEDLNEFDVAPGMGSLPSLEPLVDLIAMATEGAASNVEFVPHTRWMAEAADFAAQVRADTSDNKVFLLENMAAIPEQLGLKRFLATEGEEGEGTASSETVSCLKFAWAAREAWGQKVLREVLPEVFVQDSFSGACQNSTLSCGLWPGAPQKIVGQLVEGEVNGFCEALRLRFGPDGVKETEPEPPKLVDGVVVPAPFLIVLGGGGYGLPDGESALLRKFELFLGLAQLVEFEKDGLSIVLGVSLQSLCSHASLVSSSDSSLSSPPSSC